MMSICLSICQHTGMLIDIIRTSVCNTIPLEIENHYMYQMTPKVERSLQNINPFQHCE